MLLVVIVQFSSNDTAVYFVDEVMVVHNGANIDTIHLQIIHLDLPGGKDCCHCVVC